MQEWEAEFSIGLHVKNWELPCYVQALVYNFRTVWGKKGDPEGSLLSSIIKNSERNMTSSDILL